MKTLELRQMEEISASGNCKGTYNACIFAAYTAGTALVLVSSGLAIGAAVLAGGAAMEYCRQQYIGCVQTTPA